jgi:hypothetical protein
MKYLARALFVVFTLALVGPLAAQVPQLLSYQGRVAVGAPPVNFNGSGQFKFSLVDGGTAGVVATASATVGSGRVTAINVLSGGYGYLTQPVVTISPVGGGSGAAATANVASGNVTSITVTNTGTGYLFPPLVTIAPPNAPVYTTFWSNDGTGTFGQAPTGAVTLPVSKGLYSVLLGDTTLGNMTAIPAAVFGNADVRLRVWFDDGVNGFQLLAPDQRIAAVGYALMAAGVAAGAVGATQLADGAVAFSSLAKPPQSGTVAGAGLIHDFGSSSFTVNFPQPYTAPPVVALSLASISAAFPSAVTAQVTSSNALLFHGKVATFSHAPIAADPATNVGFYTSLAIVNGHPAMSYFETLDGTLKFVRATNADGTAWGTPITIDSGDGRFCSLAVVGNHPAIAYFDTTYADLKYVRATDATGAIWGAPVTVDSTGFVGQTPSLLVVDGNPAIAYYDATNNDLKYVRAADASGLTWGVAVTLDSTGVYTGNYNSLAVVNGHPAISYFDAVHPNGPAGTLRYVRANDADGTVWAAPITLDSTGGSHCHLVVVNGKPAIGYRTSRLDFITANPPVPFQVNWISLPP